MSAALGLLALLASAAAEIEAPATAGSTAEHPQPSIAAILNEPLLSEVSGAAGSRRTSDLLWLINDSGNGAVLHALGTDGNLRASIPIDGVRNHDWEDLAAFEHDDGPWLAIADVGDNGGVREQVAIHLLPEPVLPWNGEPLTVQRSLQLRYPDEPHDVESLAIHPTRPVGYLLSKRTRPPLLFRFRLDGEDTQVAELIAPLEGMPRLSEAELASERGFPRYRHQPTAMDLSCDGRELWILTYGSIQRYHWDGAEPDATLGSAQPQAITLLPLPQAESLAFDRHCRKLYVLSEMSPVPMLRYELPR